MNKVLFSSRSDDWATPSFIYDYFINDLGCIDLCPLHCDEDNLFKVVKFKKIFMNPPYSKISDWINYCINLLDYNNIIYLLIPVRSDTKYFHKLMNLKNYAIDLYFIKGRLKFNNSNSAPFPSVLIKLYWKPDLFVNDNIKSYFINQDDIVKIL